MKELAKGTVVGKYEIVGKLGEGGQAIVYRVRHVELHSERAVKIMNPDLLQSAVLRSRLLDEARIQANLRHPNIVRVSELVDEPGIAGLVMDLVKGPRLDQFMRDRGPMPPQQVVDQMSGILAGVAAAHERGIVHRDLKPSNVLLDPQSDGTYQPKVSDFGVAKVLSKDKKGKTKTGTALGTVLYMSPEQLKNAAGVDVRSDIWSMGVILYEMLSGRNPFDAESEFETMQRIVSGTRADLRGIRRDIPEALHAVVDRALQPDRAARFEDCSSMSKALKHALTAPATCPSPHPQRPSDPPRGGVGRLAVVGLVVALGFAVFEISSSQNSSNAGPAATALTPRATPAAAPAPVRTISQLAPTNGGLLPARQAAIAAYDEGVYRRDNRQDLAGGIQKFKESSQLDPTYPWAWVGLGTSALRREDFIEAYTDAMNAQAMAKAQQAATRDLDIRRAEWHGLLILGKIQQARGRFVDARQLYEQVNAIPVTVSPGAEQHPSTAQALRELDIIERPGGALRSALTRAFLGQVLDGNDLGLSDSELAFVAQAPYARYGKVFEEVSSNNLFYIPGASLAPHPRDPGYSDASLTQVDRDNVLFVVTEQENRKQAMRQAAQ